MNKVICKYVLIASFVQWPNNSYIWRRKVVLQPNISLNSHSQWNLQNMWFIPQYMIYIHIHTTRWKLLIYTLTTYYPHIRQACWGYIVYFCCLLFLCLFVCPWHQNCNGRVNSAQGPIHFGRTSTTLTQLRTCHAPTAHCDASLPLTRLSCHAPTTRCYASFPLARNTLLSVSYTHLTLPTNREV